MAGDPRHAKAKGYQGPATDPVAKLSENFAKMSTQVGELFAGLSHLRQTFKQFERLIARVNFMMMAQVGMRGHVPFGLRGVIGMHGGGHGPRGGWGGWPGGRGPGPSPRSTQAALSGQPGSPVNPLRPKPGTGWQGSPGNYGPPPGGWPGPVPSRGPYGPTTARGRDRGWAVARAGGRYAHGLIGRLGLGGLAGAVPAFQPLTKGLAAAVGGTLNTIRGTYSPGAGSPSMISLNPGMSLRGARKTTAHELFHHLDFRAARARGIRDSGYLSESTRSPFRGAARNAIWGERLSALFTGQVSRLPALFGRGKRGQYLNEPKEILARQFASVQSGTKNPLTLLAHAMSPAMWQKNLGKSFGLTAAAGGGFWGRFFGGGLRYAGGFWGRFFGRGGGGGGVGGGGFWGNLGRDGHGLTKQGAGQGFLAGTAVMGGLARAGAPDALETFMKSLELAAAKMGGGFVGPLATASKYLQDFADWFERQPEFLKKGFGWVTAFGVAGTGAVLGIGVLTKAAMSAATACAWLARSAGMAGGAQAAGGAGMAVGGAGLGTGAAGVGRFAKAGGLLARFAPWLAGADAAFTGYEIASADNRAQAVDSNLNGLWGLARGANPMVNVLRDVWNVTKGMSPELRNQVNSPGGKPNKAYRTQLSSAVDPMFMGVDDVYKNVQLSVLKQPMEQEIQTEQLKNMSRFMEEMLGEQKETNVKLKEIADQPGNFKA